MVSTNQIESRKLNDMANALEKTRKGEYPQTVKHLRGLALKAAEARQTIVCLTEDDQKTVKGVQCVLAG